MRSRPTLRVFAAGCLDLLLAAALVAGEPGGARPIQDNSFLIEEAYNQEEGVIQHIFNYQRVRGSGRWQATFTQEWPVSGVTHQVSYTLPAGAAASGTAVGAGDAALNYRYQVVGDGEARLAVAPRLSLLLPTGDEKRGLGAGALSLQVNLPASLALSDAFVAHGNAGATLTPRARNERGERAGTNAANLGASLVWIGGRRVNGLVEVVWSSSQVVTGPGTTRRERQMLVSPGLRCALDLPGGLQIVPGIAFPFGVGPSRGERSVILYLSFEHPLWQPAPGPPPRRSD